MPSAPGADSDLVVVGGGLAGASLALAAAQAGLSSTVIESHAVDDRRHPGFDERTIALTLASMRIFQGLGIWPAIAGEACAIHDIHVSDLGHAGMTVLDRRLVDEAALGFVVASRALGAALDEAMRNCPLIGLRCPATATDAAIDGDTALVTVDGGAGQARGRLLVIADGGRSPLRERLGFTGHGRRYAQQALVTVVGVDRDHRQRAYERFTVHGPLALLPMTGRRFAVVWTLPPERAEGLAAAAGREFLDALQATFGWRAGLFTRCGERRLYPLELYTAAEPVRPRACVLGNAAHVVHPVAGQGFNLGLRDVAELAETLALARRGNEDIGSPVVLERYARQRRRQTRLVSAFTDSLVNLFSHGSPLVAASRSATLLAVALVPPARRLLLRRTMGMHGRLPWLATGRGLDRLPAERAGAAP